MPYETCDKCETKAWYWGDKMQLCRDHFSVHELEELQDKIDKAKELFQKCKDAKYRDQLAMNHFVFNDFFNKTFMENNENSFTK